MGVASHKDARQVPSGAPSPSLPTAGGVPSASGAPSMRREASGSVELLISFLPTVRLSLTMKPSLAVALSLGRN